jgi:hypothetical protein
MASAEDIDKLALKIRALLIEHSDHTMLWIDEAGTVNDFEVDGFINLRWLAERILTDGEVENAANIG